MTPEAEKLCRLIDQRAQDAKVFAELTEEPPMIVPIYWTAQMVSVHRNLGAPFGG